MKTMENGICHYMKWMAWYPVAETLFHKIIILTQKRSNLKSAIFMVFLDFYQGRARFAEFLQNFSERQILWSLCLVVFLALTLKFPIRTSLLWHLNSKFVYVQVKNVKILGKRAHTRAPFSLKMWNLNYMCDMSSGWGGGGPSGKWKNSGRILC